MNRFPYRDVMYEDVVIGGRTYNNKSEYKKERRNFKTEILLHLQKLGCDEIVNRLKKE